MWKAPKYLVVETESLPEVFSRVVYAKYLLEQGKTASISQAAKMAGISRSAIYKYRDAVFPYIRDMSGKVTSFYVLVKDRPGMLSLLIAELYRNGANILTINQNIPVDGLAAVSLSLSLDETTSSDMDLLNALKKLEGVVEARRLTAH